MEGQAKSTADKSKGGAASGQSIGLSEIDERVLRRFYEKVGLPDENGCMLWLAGTVKGYGQLRLNGRKVGAHRLAYVIFNGEEIPEGLVVRHKCDQPLCVSPDHLELGTQADNTRDMWERGRARVPLYEANAAKTHCDRGHELIGENLIKSQLARGTRECRACANARTARYVALRRRGETWTDEQFNAYADTKYTEYMAQATLFDGESVA